MSDHQMADNILASVYSVQLSPLSWPGRGEAAGGLQVPRGWLRPQVQQRAAPAEAAARGRVPPRDGGLPLDRGHVSPRAAAGGGAPPAGRARGHGAARGAARRACGQPGRGGGGLGRARGGELARHPGLLWAPGHHSQVITPSLSTRYYLHRGGQGAGSQLPALPPAPGAAQRGVRHCRGGARHAAARQQVA